MSCGHCRIGTEHEKFGFEFGTLHPIKYEQIAELLNGIAERFDWEKVMEGDNIIGLKQVNCLSSACLSCLNGKAEKASVFNVGFSDESLSRKFLFVDSEFWNKRKDNYKLH